jgi:hypothetical protein
VGRNGGAAIDARSGKIDDPNNSKYDNDAAMLKPSTNRTLCPVTPCRACRAGIAGRRFKSSDELIALFLIFAADYSFRNRRR